MAAEVKEKEPFIVKNCALIAIATGVKAQNLRELKDKIETIDSGSIYYHFWGGRLRPRFDDPEYNNDFASWARHALHEGKIAEQLGAIDPTTYTDLGDLRKELIEVIEERLYESEIVPWARSNQEFSFITSQIIVFPTNKYLNKPRDLTRIIPAMSPGSIFYHFIDARRRTPNHSDDFSEWLSGFDGKYEELKVEIAAVDPYFPTITEIREQLSSILKNYFGGTS